MATMMTLAQTVKARTKAVKADREWLTKAQGYLESIRPGGASDRMEILGNGAVFLVAREMSQDDFTDHDPFMIVVAYAKGGIHLDGLASRDEANTRFDRIVARLKSETAPSRPIPRARFLVSRFSEGGRGRGYFEETSEYALFENREMGLWDVVDELKGCGFEADCAVTEVKSGERGWDTRETIYVKRLDGKAVDSRMMDWLKVMSEL